MFKLNGNLKQLILAIVDALLVAGSLVIALLLRFDMDVPGQYLSNLESLWLPVVIINLVIFLLFGLYRRLWRYASVDELMLIVLAISTGAAGSYFYSYYFEVMLPRSVYIIYWFLLLLVLGGSRISLRILYNLMRNFSNHSGAKNVLIVGAGDGGVIVAREFKKYQAKLGTRLVGFIDDDPNKQKQVIQGIPVLGTREKLQEIVEAKHVEEIVVAIPSASYRELRELVDICEGLPVKLKTVPGLFEILEGQVNITHLKEVEIEDLLRRPTVKVDIKEISGYLAGKVVMITGAGGSIGSELCRQVALLGPKELVLLDNDENGMFYIDMELRKKHARLKVHTLLRDVQDRQSLEDVFSSYGPQFIFHAAAYKHVPLVEDNVAEAVQNNVQGSMNMVDLAKQYGAERFVLISTDKAVKPSSAMGATKRATEVYMQYQARQNGKCVFCAVRFGNVLGSRGSVVTLFREQIAAGGPVTVTHPEMTRYFMTIPEAVQLVIQAGSFGRGGEIFVLDMGEPVKIVDLARDMILLSGLQPERDIEIKFTGIRPGEKLYEELFNEKESFVKTKHERIFIAPQTLDGDEVFLEELRELEELLGVNLEELTGIGKLEDLERGRVGKLEGKSRK